MKPEYVLDFGKGSVFIYDRTANTVEECKFADFITLEWLKKDGVSIAGEAAHFHAVSPYSKSQPFANQDEIRKFYALCVERKVDLRFLPHRDIAKFRRELVTNRVTKSGTTGRNKDDVLETTYYFPSIEQKITIFSKEAKNEKEKTDEVDVKTWSEKMKEHPYIWNNAKRMDPDVEFYDTKERVEKIYDDFPNPFTSGMLLRSKQKIAALILKQSDGDKYWESSAGQLVIKSLKPIYDRVSTHNGVFIKDGIATTTIGDKTITIVLTEDVLGFSLAKNKKSFGDSGFTKGPLKEAQLVACGMCLVDKDGERYINRLTDKPYGFKDIKQYAMCSTPFHMKPGFLRPNFYHSGIKNVFKKILKKHYGEEYMDETILEHRLLLKFVRNTCRIAYELTIKAMIKELNDKDKPKGLEKWAA
jgi:hypothetical protein